MCSLPRVDFQSWPKHRVCQNRNPCTLNLNHWRSFLSILPTLKTIAYRWDISPSCLRARAHKTDTRALAHTLARTCARAHTHTQQSSLACGRERIPHTHTHTHTHTHHTHLPHTQTLTHTYHTRTRVRCGEPFLLLFLTLYTWAVDAREPGTFSVHTFSSQGTRQE
jgi:hypothetical protein